jgi:nicotinamidase-related amidase
MDTHTPVEYSKSEESTIFPDIHCEFNTPGWNLMINPRNPEISEIIEEKVFNEPKDFSIENEFVFVKDKFSIWEGNQRYADWFNNTFDKDVNIYIVGVATNYCVFMNAIGYPEKGYENICLISDCIQGIKSFPDGTPDSSYGENIITMLNNGIKIIDPEEV